MLLLAAAVRERACGAELRDAPGSCQADTAWLEPVLSASPSVSLRSQARLQLELLHGIANTPVSALKC